MSFWGDPFADKVEKATAETLPFGSEEIVPWLDIADQIKGKSVTPVHAMRTLKNRITHSNPNVQLMGLKLADVCVKNSGHHFLQQVASKEFMDSLEGILTSQTIPNPDVRSKILELTQTWAYAFRDRSDLSLVWEVYNRLKLRGYAFPPLDPAAASSALVDTATAPTWTDSADCDRCRTPFTTFNRKHHCRNCGGTFCQTCSSRTAPLPKFGITEAVRVCDGCFGRLGVGGGTAIADPASRSGSGARTPASYPGQSGSRLTSAAAADQLDADIQRAIQLSLEESPPPQRKYQTSSSGGGGGAAMSKPAVSFKLPATTAPSKPSKTDEDDLARREEEELERAIAESLKEMRGGEAAAAAARAGDGGASMSASASPVPVYTNPNALTELEMDNVRLFAELVDKLEEEGVGRSWEGGAVGGEAVEALHHQIALLQPKLVSNLSDAVQKYRMFVSFNNKLEGALRAYDDMLNRRVEAARSAGITSVSGTATGASQAAAMHVGYSAGAPSYAGYMAATSSYGLAPSGPAASPAPYSYQASAPPGSATLAHQAAPSGYPDPQAAYSVAPGSQQAPATDYSYSSYSYPAASTTVDPNQSVQYPQPGPAPASYSVPAPTPPISYAVPAPVGPPQPQAPSPQPASYTPNPAPSQVYMAPSPQPNGNPSPNLAPQAAPVYAPGPAPVAPVAPQQVAVADASGGYGQVPQAAPAPVQPVAYDYSQQLQPVAAAAPVAVQGQQQAVYAGYGQPAAPVQGAVPVQAAAQLAVQKAEEPLLIDL